MHEAPFDFLLPALQQDLPPATGPGSGSPGEPPPAAAPSGGAAAGTQADGAPGGAPNPDPPSPFSSLWIFGVLFLFMWLFVIRPERKRQKERAAMLGAIQKGDQVVTTGGIHGTVARLDDQTLTLKVDDQVRLKVDRNAIARIASSKEKGSEAGAAKEKAPAAAAS